MIHLDLACNRFPRILFFVRCWSFLPRGAETCSPPSPAKVLRKTNLIQEALMQCTASAIPIILWSHVSQYNQKWVSSEVNKKKNPGKNWTPKPKSQSSYSRRSSIWGKAEMCGKSQKIKGTKNFNFFFNLQSDFDMKMHKEWIFQPPKKGKWNWEAKQILSHWDQR